MHHLGDSLFHIHSAAEHTHQYESQCSEELEKDPCHRKVVHHDENADCAHDSHISATYVECMLCSVAPLRHEGLMEEPMESILYSIQSKDMLYEGQEAFVSTFKNSSESRGPPPSAII
jgi:hypothetical protein